MPPRKKNSTALPEKIERIAKVLRYDWPYKNFISDVFDSGLPLEDILAADLLDDYIDYWNNAVTGLSITYFLAPKSITHLISCKLQAS